MRSTRLFIPLLMLVAVSAAANRVCDVPSFVAVNVPSLLGDCNGKAYWPVMSATVTAQMLKLVKPIDGTSGVWAPVGTVQDLRLATGVPIPRTTTYKVYHFKNLVASSIVHNVNAATETLTLNYESLTIHDSATPTLTPSLRAQILTETFTGAVAPPVVDISMVSGTETTRLTGLTLNRMAHVARSLQVQVPTIRATRTVSYPSLKILLVRADGTYLAHYELKDAIASEGGSTINLSFSTLSFRLGAPGGVPTNDTKMGYDLNGNKAV